MGPAARRDPMRLTPPGPGLVPGGERASPPYSTSTSHLDVLRERQSEVTIPRGDRHRQRLDKAVQAWDRFPDGVDRLRQHRPSGPRVCISAAPQPMRIFRLPSHRGLTSRSPNRLGQFLHRMGRPGLDRRPAFGGYCKPRTASGFYVNGKAVISADPPQDPAREYEREIAIVIGLAAPGRIPDGPSPVGPII